MIMQRLLGHLHFTKVYIDDIIIYSENLDHFGHIGQVIKILRSENLRLNPDKCQWLCTEIKVLGLVVSVGQTSIDPDKIEAIQKRIAPRTVKQVQEFLGLTGYYRSFIRDFAKIAAPILSLLKSDIKFVWSDECNTAF